MFGISYDNWKSTCEMYLTLNAGSKKAYLQWFPFWKLSEEDKRDLLDEDFYNNYIKSGGFVFFPAVMSYTENYIQKSDGSFRDSTLVSPILYLVVQAIGKAIYDNYTPERAAAIETFYAGNYMYSRAKYTKDYDDFYKAINAWSDNHDFFIKTDITNFYGNINIDKLIDRIDLQCNDKEVKFTQTQLMLFKELFIYCGKGRFPLIENSVALSFLATIVYLDEVDCNLYNFINEKIQDISSFKMIRYVDDLYILFSSEKELDDLTSAYNQIRNEYSSLLKEKGLSLNTKKCCIKRTVDIDEELKKSLYADFVHGEENNIPDLFGDNLLSFVNDLEYAVIHSQLTHEKYEALIQKHFKKDDVEYTPHEVFNHLVYDNYDEWDGDISDVLTRIIKVDVASLSIDPKPLTVMVMKSGKEKAIKTMLASLFERHRLGMWNSYDTTIAISYLIQSRFNHIDLLNVIKDTSPHLYEYYQRACKTSFLNQVKSRKWNRYIKYIDTDTIASFLYFMFLVEHRKGNYLSAFAYYKNFFDRMSADMSFKIGGRGGKDKKPNYCRYYKDDHLKSLYANINNADIVIDRAHSLRNSNPIDHASAELIKKETTRKDLYNSMKDLDDLINQFATANASYI